MGGEWAEESGVTVYGTVSTGIGIQGCGSRVLCQRAVRGDCSRPLAMPAFSKANGCLTVEGIEDLATSHLFTYCLQVLAGNSEFKVAGEKLECYSTR